MFSLKEFLFVLVCSAVVKADLLSVDEQNIADQCFQVSNFNCDPNAKYRTIDGTCNNLQKPWWGAFDSPHVRLLKARFKDGISTHRVSTVDGSDLPSARLCRTQLMPNGISSDTFTRMFMVWSQIVSHETNLNPQQTGTKCCAADNTGISSTAGICRPIAIPSDDPFYAQFNRKCMEYHQSLMFNCSALDGKPILPIVKNTHYIDGSFMYGASQATLNTLRAGQQGKLKVQANTPNNRQYLPNGGTCPFTTKNCYESGDARVNQHLDLAVIQTMLLRVHNLVCDKLIEVNPSWASNDTLVFEESRRIVVAFIQHIIYKEWLPILIGPIFTAERGLSPAPGGEYSSLNYDPNVNPGSSAEYAGAAFRALHSLIPSTLTINPNMSTSSNRRVINFSATVQRPGDWLQEGDTYDSVLLGLLSEPQENQDRFISQEIGDKFLNFDSDISKPYGEDLASIDIQRGRNFGLGTYNDHRELCGFPRAKDWADFKDNIPDQNLIDLLQKVYKSVDDVDVYVGAHLEQLVFGTLSFPSLRCVFATSFTRYKAGDRFFYEVQNQPGSFTPGQLAFIKSINLAALVCLGGDQITSTTQNAFLPMDPNTNKLVRCDSIRQAFDLSSFKAS